MYVEAQVTSGKLPKLRVLAWDWSTGNVPYDLPRLSIKFGRGPRGIPDSVGKNDYSADKLDMIGSRSLVAIIASRKPQIAQFLRVAMTIHSISHLTVLRIPSTC